MVERTLWNAWKQAFERWEQVTGRELEESLRDARWLEPAGAAVSAVFRAADLRHRGLAELWSAVGLPSRRDQERTLFLLHELESKLLDLEERLEDQERGAP